MLAYPNITSWKNLLLDPLVMWPMPTVPWYNLFSPIRPPVVATAPSHCAFLSEQPIQGSKGVTYAPFFSCKKKAQLLITEPQGSPHTRHQISKRVKKVGTEIERSLHWHFTSSRSSGKIPEDKKDTIIMPLVKGKPRETENVCRESLKIILENQARETL